MHDGPLTGELRRVVDHLLDGGTVRAGWNFQDLSIVKRIRCGRLRRGKSHGRAVFYLFIDTPKTTMLFDRVLFRIDIEHTRATETG